MIQSTIKFSQTKTQQSNPQIFTVWSDEIEGRIDPHFYKPLKYSFKGVALNNFVEKISSFDKNF